MMYHFKWLKLKPLAFWKIVWLHFGTATKLLLIRKVINILNNNLLIYLFTINVLKSIANYIYYQKMFSSIPKLNFKLMQNRLFIHKVNGDTVDDL